MTPSSKNSNSLTWPMVAKRVAIVSGVFCFLVIGMLLVSYIKSSNIAENPKLPRLKAELAANPKDTSIKNKIREFDLELRENHFCHRAFQQYGTWLLIGGVIVFLVSYKVSTAKQRIPKPQKRSEVDYKKEIFQTCGAIIFLGFCFFFVAHLMACQAKLNSLLHAPLATDETTAKAPEGGHAPQKDTNVPTFSTPAELAQNWPRFRGVSGSGISAFSNVPVAWDVKTGSNILWKTEVPISGPSSPLVWGKRIFLVGATADKREVYCFDTNGKLLWQKEVNPKRASAEPPNVMEDSGGYAASTPCTDGQRVYAIYANGDLAAFDFDGNQIWAKNLGRPDNMYGLSSSLEMYQDKLIVQFDQGESAKANKSKILAFDSATGQSAWETETRPVPSSWSTPFVVNDGKRDLLVAAGNPFVMAYDPVNGKEIWRAKVFQGNGEMTPSPIFSGGFVYAALEGEKLFAIPADGQGDVTANVAWSAEDGLPDIVSPLCDGTRMYLINSSGTMTCYAAKDDKKLWDKDLELSFKSSPSLVGDKVYAIAENGVGVTIRAWDEYQELARSDLGEEVLSSPAFADGRIYIRGKMHLFCIGLNHKEN